MKTHFRYSPSATKRWVNCPGSIDAPPNDSSSYSLEGDEAHDVAENALRNGTLVDQSNPELHAAVSTYVDFVADIRRDKRPFAEFIEDTRIHADYDDVGGTSDYVAFYEDGGTVLHFVDLKYGIGIPVLAEENYQLLTYATIYASWFESIIDKYRLTIIQPRCPEVEPIQTWETYPKRVKEHAKLIHSVRDKRTFKAGDWCRFCSLRPTCPVLRHEMLNVAQQQFERAEVSDLLELHAMADTIRGALNQLEDVLIQKAKAGFELPGHKVVESVGHRKWAENERKILKRLRELGINRKQAMKSKLLSPAALEKLLDKESRKGAFDGLITRDRTGLRVVPESARGEPQLLSVNDVFKDDLP